MVAFCGPWKCCKGESRGQSYLDLVRVVLHWSSGMIFFLNPVPFSVPKRLMNALAPQMKACPLDAFSLMCVGLRGS